MRGILLRPSLFLHVVAACAFLYPDSQMALERMATVQFGLRGWWVLAFRLLPPLLILARFAYGVLYQSTKEFELTDERLIVRFGVMLRVEDEVELYRVVDVTQSVNLIQRMLGLGTVYVVSTDRTGTVVMPTMSQPSNVRNDVRTEAEHCKNRPGTRRILE